MGFFIRQCDETLVLRLTKVDSVSSLAAWKKHTKVSANGRNGNTSNESLTRDLSATASLPIPIWVWWREYLQKSSLWNCLHRPPLWLIMNRPLFDLSAFVEWLGIVSGRSVIISE